MPSEIKAGRVRNEVRAREKQERADEASRRAGLKPPIVTAAELQVGLELQKRFDQLSEWHQSLTHDALGERWRKAETSFLSDPTPETFSVAKIALFERSFFRADTRCRSLCWNLIGQFCASQVFPWARVIVERNLETARAALTKVRAAEDARCRKLLGRPLSRPNEIVIEAERPVRHLEALAVRLNGPARGVAPSALLERFEAIGTDRFDALIDPAISAEAIEAELLEAERVEASRVALLDDALFPSNGGNAPAE